MVEERWRRLVGGLHPTAVSHGDLPLPLASYTVRDRTSVLLMGTQSPALASLDQPRPQSAQVSTSLT